MKDSVKKCIDSITKLFDNDRHKMLNNRYWITSMFSKSIVKRKGWIDMNTVLSDNIECPFVLMKNIDRSEIELGLISCLDSYEKLHNIRSRYDESYNDLPDVIHSMSRLLDKNNIVHCLDWSFNWNSKAHNIKSYLFEYNLHVDIIGCVFVGGASGLVSRMKMFAIIANRENQPIKRSDYITEYALQLMNINLLRLGSTEKNSSIKTFFRSIKTRESYVRIGGFLRGTRVNDAMNNKTVDNILELIWSNYQHNHNIWNKHYGISDVVDSDSERDLTESGDEISTVLTENDYNKIISTKFF